MNNFLNYPLLNKRFWPALVASTYIASSLAGCGQGDGTGAPREELQNAVREEAKSAQKSFNGLTGAVLKGGELQGSDAQGRPLWKLAAREIRTAGDMVGTTPKNATLLDGKATLYRAGKEEATFSSQKILMFNTPSGIRLQMLGKVIATSKTLAGAPVTVTAPRADVDVTKRLIAASGGVVARQKQIEVTGPVLKAQTSLSTAELPSGAVAKTPDATVKAKTAQVDWQKQTLVAQSVTATRQDVVLTGQTLNADASATRGVLTGNVQAKSPKGVATAPRAEFDWKRDHIIAPSAVFNGEGATLRASSLATDSHLKVAQASGVRIDKDGSTLTARSARGFDGLTRLVGQGVVLVKGDSTLRAATVNARDWNSDAAKIVASGGATVQNPKGNISAQSAVWSGSAQNGHVEANGNVVFESNGSNVRGDNASSDGKFQNAVLTGHVQGRLQDGTRIKAQKIEKNGETYVASNGATAWLTTKGALGTIEMSAPRVEATNGGDKAVASGGVTMKSQTGAVAHAPSAVYDRKARTVTAKGGVDFYDPQRGLRQKGESLVADLGMKRVILEKVKGQGNMNIFDGKKLFQ